MIADQTITVHPLAPERIGDFERLFGPKGACAGCWCTYFRLPHRVRQESKADERKAAMIARIQAGPPPGLLAYRGDEPVGWVQVGPRADIPEWNNAKRASTPLPDAPADDHAVWAISCFFFAKKMRGKGLSHRMVAEAVDFARRGGARLIEASPMDEAEKSGSIGLFVGSTRVFRQAGFFEVARRKPGRPLMRLAL